jgi:outer membrane protein OmpA-like peptidoglycan-associated protein
MFTPERRRAREAWLASALALQLGCAAHPTLAQQPLPAESAAASSQAVPRSVRRELDRAQMQLRSLLQARAQDDALLVVREPGSLILRLPCELLFKPDSASLRANAMDLGLGVVAQLLQKRRRLVAQIAVYTDDIGGAEANLSFSAQRAAALVTALRGMRISADRLSGVGEGEAGNLAANDSAEGRTQNRRVEVSFALSGQVRQ